MDRGTVTVTFRECFRSQTLITHSNPFPYFTTMAIDKHTVTPQCIAYASNISCALGNPTFNIFITARKLGNFPPWFCLN